MRFYVLPQLLKLKGSEKKGGHMTDSRLGLRGPTEGIKTQGESLREPLIRLFSRFKEISVVVGDETVAGDVRSGPTRKVQEIAVRVGEKTVATVSLREDTAMDAPTGSGTGEGSEGEKGAEERRPVITVSCTYTIVALQKEWLKGIQRVVGRHLWEYGCVGADTPESLKQRRDEAEK